MSEFRNHFADVEVMGSKSVRLIECYGALDIEWQTKDLCSMISVQLQLAMEYI